MDTCLFGTLKRLIRVHGVPEGLPGILPQPMLEAYLEAEVLPEILLKERPEFLGADDALAGQVVVWTSIISMLTLFILIAWLRSIGIF